MRRTFIPSHLRLSHALVLAVLFCGSVISSCDFQRDPMDTSTLPSTAYASYVSAFTTGLISSRDEIRVELALPVDSTRQGEEARRGLLTFEPNIPGQLRFDGPSTLVFQPDEPLTNGKNYTGILALNKLRPNVPDSLQRLRFGFSIVPQGVRLTDGLLRPNPLRDDDPSSRQYDGTFMTFDSADPLKVEEMVTASQNNAPLNVSWTHGDKDRRHTFIIDGIVRGDFASEVELRWSGRPLGLNDLDSSRTILVPSLSTFSVSGIDLEQDADQVVTVYFSDALSATQDLTGLVYLADGSEVRLERRGDAILLYPANRRAGTIELIVDASLANDRGQTLGQQSRHSLAFANLLPAVELTGTGTIVPSSQGASIPFRAVALHSVDVEVLKVYAENVPQFFQQNEFDGNRALARVGRPVFRGKVPLRADAAVDYSAWNYFAIDLAKYVDVEPGAIYRVSMDFGSDDIAYDCPEGLPLVDDSGRSTMSDFDKLSWRSDYEYSYAGYSYYDEEADSPCESAYYANKSVSRNFFASNIGLIAKRGRTGEMMVVATDLLTTEPLGSIDIELLNLQQQVEASAKTGPNGVAVFNIDYQPFLAVAKRGAERAYLRVDANEALNISSFDVGGESTGGDVRGMIYGERGVWRPGDSIYLSLILERSNAERQANVPVTFELRDPRGQLVTRRGVAEAAPGMYDLRTATAADAPTGPWMATVRAGGSVIQQTVRVEAVMPNRLKAELSFASTPVPLYASPTATGTLAVRWLTGLAAGPLRTEVDFSAGPTRPPFDGYDDYEFDDESKAVNLREMTIFDDKLNAAGEATIELPIADVSSLPGMLKARFTTRAYESTGAFSTVTSTQTLSPYPAYVGLRSPTAESYYGLDASKPQTFAVVLLDDAGKPVSSDRLDIEVYDIDWSYWWERENTGSLASYVTNRAQHIALEQTTALPRGRGAISLDLSELSFGRKMIRVVDPVGGHAATATFYLQDPRWAYDPASRPGGAELLAFNLDAEEYAPGDRATVQLPAFAGGRALLSIENGNQVLGYRWVVGTAERQTVSVDITAAMGPNAYVHVVLLQPHGQTANDQPIRLFGVQPFRVTDPLRRLSPKLDMRSAEGPRDAELSPEAPFVVRVSEADGRAMSYTVSVVEEGLLDITSFTTPDPYTRFNSRQSLGVRTWDMYSHVLGAFTGQLAGLLAIGGDEDSGEAPDPRANRFRPVVKHLGPFRLAAGATAVHTLDMPNYVGSVRAMVVATTGESAFGSDEVTLPVRRPLMALATLPRVLGPGEMVDLPVTVFAMDASIKQVSVKLDGLELLNAEEVTRQLTFSEPGEQIARFRVRTPNRLGVARVKVLAQGGGFSASDEIELQVRAPAADVTSVVRKVVEPGASWAAPFAAIGMEGTMTAALEVSGSLPVNLEDRLGYLTRYPHGCLEQVVSSAFPQLYVGEFTELSVGRAATVQRNVEAALQALRKFSSGKGTFTYWPSARSHESIWATIYAGHFLTEASERGYRLPEGMLDAWVSRQRRDADAWTPARRDVDGQESATTQAYRLFVLARAGQPRLGAMNRLRGRSEDLEPATQQLLAAAYALADQRDAATKLLASPAAIASAERGWRYYNYTYGSPERDLAMSLYTTTLVGDKTLAFELAQQVSNNLSSERWYSTQTTSWSLLAMASYLRTMGGGSAEPLTYTYVLGSINETVAQTEPVRLASLPTPEVGADSSIVTIRNTGSQAFYARVVTTGIPTTSQSKNESSQLSMRSVYTNLAGQAIDVTELEMGESFVAVTTVTHPGRQEAYQNLALTEIFPSGWEIRNRRLEGRTEGGDEPDRVEYQDIRDDRVLSYFDLSPGESITITTELTAAYPGRFYLPDRYCQAMYDNNISARKAGGWVEVSAEPIARG